VSRNGSSQESVRMEDAVRQALRAELLGRGYPLASDTVSLLGELYVRGPDDRAAAIFEFKQTAGEAAETMYQGRWTADLPPRFAVLPAAERDLPEVEFLGQAGLSTLFYADGGGDILFFDFEAVLHRIGPPAGADAPL
jgi:hypothetical protein